MGSPRVFSAWAMPNSARSPRARSPGHRGSSGIGLAIARMLADDGFELTLAARTQEKVEAAAAELGAHAVAANVASEEDCERARREHAERLAGSTCSSTPPGSVIGGPIEQISTKTLDLQLDVNLRGTVHRHEGVDPDAARVARARRQSRLDRGHRSRAELAVYGATKAAVISLTNSMNASSKATASASARSAPASSTRRWRRGPACRRRDDPTRGLRRDRPALAAARPAARIPQVVVERLGDRP